MNYKILGLGGAGRNILNHMISDFLDSDHCIYMDTHIQAVSLSKAPFFQLGPEICKGYPAVESRTGTLAAQYSGKEILSLIKNTDYLIIIAGMGGGCGTGASQIIAQIAKECCFKTVAIVTSPPKFQSAVQKKVAEEGIEKLRMILGNDLHVLPIKLAKLFELFIKSDQEVSSKVKDILISEKLI